jgi:hypothetical protein
MLAASKIEAARAAVEGKRFRLSWAMTIVGECTLTHFDQFGEARYLFHWNDGTRDREITGCLLGRELIETTI